MRCPSKAIRFRLACDGCRSDGFTLLEVLVALVILGLGVAFLSGTFTDSLARAERTRNDDLAANLADGVLARLGRDVPLRIGNINGSDGEIYWRLAISQAAASGTPIPLDRVDLTVTSANGRSLGHWVSLRIAPPHG